MKITNIRVYALTRRLIEPFTISYKTWHSVQNLLLLIDTDRGITGCGEAAPFKPITDDTYDDALHFLRQAVPVLNDQNPCDIKNIHHVLHKVVKGSGINSQTGKAAVDFACHDILGKHENKPVYKVLGSEEPRIVPTTITIGANPPQKMAADAVKLMDRFGRNGLERIKLKITGKPELDVERTLAVATVFPGQLTLDANQAYANPKVAVQTFNELSAILGSKILLIEEPCPKRHLEKMRYVTEHCEIPIYADESVVSLNDLKQVVETRSAKGINIKLLKAGGIFWGMKLAALAEQARLYVMVGSRAEGAIGIAAGAHFASAVSNVSSTDLDTDFYFETRIVREESTPPFKFGARLPLDAPGLGVVLEKGIEDVLNTKVFIERLV